MSIKREIESRKNGTLTRLVYKSDMTPKMSAAWKKSGWRIEKITETTARTGCNYNNIKRVQEKKASGELGNKHIDIYEWVIPNKIKRHKEKGTEYLVMDTIPSKQANTRTKYIVSNGTKVEVTDDFGAIEEMLIPSERNKRGERPDVMTIKMENVISFNKVSA